MQTLSDRERLHKIQEAVRLLREVEFSYEYGNPIRTMIYGVMVENFSLTRLGSLMTELKAKVWKEQQNGK